MSYTWISVIVTLVDDYRLDTSQLRHCRLHKCYTAQLFGITVSYMVEVSYGLHVETTYIRSHEASQC